MDALLQALTGTVAIVIGGVFAVLAVGWFLLWRSRRKLRQTT
jgi:LPXTG-motif cell wall-anchored protein